MSFISSEIDLDRDVPNGEIEVDSSDKPINVDWVADVKWNMDDTSVDTTMENEVKKVEALYG